MWTNHLSRVCTGSEIDYPALNLHPGIQNLDAKFEPTLVTIFQNDSDLFFSPKYQESNFEK